MFCVRCLFVYDLDVLQHVQVLMVMMRVFAASPFKKIGGTDDAK